MSESGSHVSLSKTQDIKKYLDINKDNLHRIQILYKGMKRFTFIDGN